MASLYLSISLIILYEGGERYLHHSDGHDLQINSYLMSVISAIGFLFHGAAAWVLYKGRKASINVYAVFLHSFFDFNFNGFNLLRWYFNPPNWLGRN